MNPRENSYFTRYSTFYDRVFPSFGVSVDERIYWPTKKLWKKRGKILNHSSSGGHVAKLSAGCGERYIPKHVLILSECKG